jgi:hypothetical protein
MRAYDRRHIESLVRPGEVHRDVYTDPVIFDLEMQRLWRNAWIYVGHESQVKNPGDFYTTTIGAEPVIMVRGKDGEVNVIYNRCSHKGAMVASAATSRASAVPITAGRSSWTARFRACPRVPAMPTPALT